jgi:Dihydrodipicolinate synthetase family
MIRTSVHRQLLAGVCLRRSLGTASSFSNPAKCSRGLAVWSNGQNYLARRQHQFKETTILPRRYYSSPTNDASLITQSGDFKPPSPGVWVPAVCFFTADDKLDFAAITKHTLRLAQGVHGFLIHGSNGESMHLSRSERVEVISHVRKTLDDNGFGHVQLMAGTPGVQSSWEVIELCREAAEAGAGWAMVLPPSYWVAAMSKDNIKDFYTEVGIFCYQACAVLQWTSNSLYQY